MSHALLPPNQFSLPLDDEIVLDYSKPSVSSKIPVKNREDVDRIIDAGRQVSRKIEKLKFESRSFVQ